MAVREKRDSVLSQVTHLRFTTNKTIAVLVWLGGLYFTTSFFMQLGAIEAGALGAAFVLQSAITRAQSYVWRGESRHWFGLLAIAVDAGLNAAGIYPFIAGGLANTDAWKMAAALTEASAPTVATHAIVSFGVGVAIAAAAEYFWSLD